MGRPSREFKQFTRPNVFLMEEDKKIVNTILPIINSIKITRGRLIENNATHHLLEECENLLVVKEDSDDPEGGYLVG